MRVHHAENTPIETILELHRAIKISKARHELQRAQSLLLRFQYCLSARDIAVIIGWSPGSIRNLHSAYAKRGLSVLSPGKRGGRRNHYLSTSREQQLLKAFNARARQTGYLDVHGLKGAYEHLVGHRCALSTIYRLIKRHGLSRRLPYARR